MTREQSHPTPHDEWAWAHHDAAARFHHHVRQHLEHGVRSRHRRGWPPFDAPDFARRLRWPRRLRAAGSARAGVPPAATSALRSSSSSPRSRRTATRSFRSSSAEATAPGGRAPDRSTPRCSSSRTKDWSAPSRLMAAVACLRADRHRSRGGDQTRRRPRALGGSGRLSRWRPSRSSRPGLPVACRHLAGQPHRRRRAHRGGAEHPARGSPEDLPAPCGQRVPFREDRGLTTGTCRRRSRRWAHAQQRRDHRRRDSLPSQQPGVARVRPSRRR